MTKLNHRRLPLVGLAALSLLASTAHAQSLESLRSTWPELNLAAKLNSMPSPQVEQGSNLEIRVNADDDAAVAVILVDAEGRARVAAMKRPEGGNRVTRGTPLIFPDVTAGEFLYANLPVGKGNAFVVASRDPIFQTGEFAAWDTAAAVARKVSGAGTPFDIERLPFYVTSSQATEFVSEAEFVRFFAEATRDVRNPSKGFPIKFESDSDQLTEWSRRQLDEVSSGMKDSGLSGKGFRLEGHTDDVGTPEYNMGLSERRANAVLKYLVGKGIDSKRIETQAMGESAPIEPSQTDAARAKNRRVEIRRIDE